MVRKSLGTKENTFVDIDIDINTNHRVPVHHSIIIIAIVDTA